jgi:hypothetical protein
MRPVGRLPPEGFERGNDQSIPRQHRERFTIATMNRGLAPAPVRIVETGKIVVDK